MSHFDYHNGFLHAEGVSLADIAAQFGTPCYVYSRNAIEACWQAFDDAFATRKHLVCYAVKANSNLAILNLLARLGSGFDIVSAGELMRVIKAGGDPAKVVFSGVGKCADEMRFALGQNIKCFNVESLAELITLNNVAMELKTRAPVSLRVNPDVDAKTHAYIATGLKENKFGIDFNAACAIYQKAKTLDHINIVGIDCHIGSQITSLDPFQDALEKILALVTELQQADIHLEHIDIGGGLGIAYEDEIVPTAAAYIHLICETIKNDALEIIIEPGRSIVGTAGVLITEVLYLKTTANRNFAIVDAAMNDFIRPSLYQGWHQIKTLAANSNEQELVYDIVGPVCETGDFLGKARPLRLKQGAHLAICAAGAYGFSMSSNYNSRPRAAEIIVDAEKIYETRRRETIAELMNGETLIPEI